MKFLIAVALVVGTITVPATQPAPAPLAPTAAPLESTVATSTPVVTRSMTPPVTLSGDHSLDGYMGWSPEFWAYLHDNASIEATATP